MNRTDPGGLAPVSINNCQACLPKSKLNNGYSESVVTSITLLRPLWVIEGTEVVFDFATLEIGEFEPTFETTPSSLQFDIGLISGGRVYQMSHISGFEPEPDGNLQREYGPSVVNLALGVSAGSLISVKGGKQEWLAEDFSLTGYGYWYGAEASGLDWASLLVAAPVTAIIGVPANFSYYKSSTNYRYGTDLGNVCNPEDAQRFLEVLETWPYPYFTGYTGLYPGRFSAINKFKQYAGIE